MCVGVAVKREHRDLLIKTKYILCRFPILIAALVVITDCSGELACSKSSSQFIISLKWLFFSRLIDS